MAKTKTTKRAKPTHLSPQQVRTMAQHLRLQRDNLSTTHGWIMLDGDSISLAEQSNGEPARAVVRLPRREFDRLIAWYIKPQRLTP